MAKFNLELNSYDSINSIFSTQEQRDEWLSEKIKKIDLKDIKNFEGHPFGVEMDDDMQKLIDSVKENGVLNPVLVRPSKDGKGYEMIAGHRRKFALENLGIAQVDAIVRDFDDDTATILMVDSNIQREHIKPTERGYAYKMRLDAMKHQGKQVDDYSQDIGIEYNSSTSRQVVGKLESSDIMGKEIGMTGRQIQRFIRLTFLIKPIQKMVDGVHNKGLTMAFNPAVELSYLTEEHQKMLYEEMVKEEVTPSLAQCQELKKKEKAGTLTSDDIFDVIKAEKPNQRQRISIDTKQINRYFPKNYTQKQKTDLIVELLRDWSEKNKKKDVQTR
jgi:hypothetical protein